VVQQGVALLGAGQHALEVAEYCRRLGHRIVCFVEEWAAGSERDVSRYGAPILTFEDDLSEYAHAPAVTSVGDPRLKERLVSRWPGSAFFTLVSPQTWLASGADLSAGSVVCPFSAVGNGARLGMHTLVNVGCTVSHDVAVGDYASLAPRSTIGGGTDVGAYSFVGIGATIVDHVRIGRAAYIAAGAVVVADVEDGVRVMGVPARVVGPNELT
jgi:sugar O-acyltransferase (sialic acid O-acetyltransferase NeuD family)